MHRLVSTTPRRGRGRAVSALGAATLAAAFLTAVAADAQQRPQNQLFNLSRETAAGPSAQAARARARRGDCAGALAAFDEALRTSIEPTLRRDRGLCHEKLGNIFPAIDDLRAYLTASPDAPDAEGVRERLYRLEEQAGVGGKAEGGDKKKDDGDAGATMSIKASTGTTNSDGTRYREVDTNRDLESDESSPLRAGKGWILGPYLGVRRWFTEANSFTASSAWAETLGIRLAHSFNDTSSLFGEAGYERFNTTSVDPFSVSGLSAQFGYEARLRFKRTDADNLFILGLGLGYEHLFERVNGISSVTARTFSGILARFRAAYRHNFGPGAALEIAADGGVGKFLLVGSSGAEPVAGMGALQLSLVFGL
jgi:hypothetical protein